MNQKQIDHTYVGDIEAGEIKIVSDDESLKELSKSREILLEKHNITNNQLGIVFQDEYIIVKRDPVRFPNGTLGSYLRIIELPALTGAAGVVMMPICGDTVYLIKTFRHPTRSWEIEFPRGFRPSSMTDKQAVAMEISEEIGLEIEEIVELGAIAPNSGVLASTVQAFLVRVRAGVGRPEENGVEAIQEVLPRTTQELENMIRVGEIRDAFTLATFQLAQSKHMISTVDSADT